MGNKKQDEFGDAPDEFGDAPTTSKPNGAVNWLNNHSFGYGVGGGNPDIPKDQYYGQEAEKAAPMIGATALTALYPELSLPVAMAIGGGTAGGIRAAENIGEKQPLYQGVKREAAWGAGGPLIGKIGSIASRSLGLGRFFEGGPSYAKDLADKLESVGPGTTNLKLPMKLGSLSHTSGALTQESLPGSVQEAIDNISSDLGKTKLDSVNKIEIPSDKPYVDTETGIAGNKDEIDALNDSNTEEWGNKLLKGVDDTINNMKNIRDTKNLSPNNFMAQGADTAVGQATLPIREATSAVQGARYPVPIFKNRLKPIWNVTGKQGIGNAIGNTAGETAAALIERLNNPEGNQKTAKVK